MNVYRKPTKIPDSSRAPAFSDEALALQFSHMHGDDLRYVSALGRWFCWNGTKWERDETLRTMHLARELCRTVARESPKPLARRIASANTIAAVERLARADRRHASHIDQWDSNPWKLNTPAGTVDLKTGQLLPHNRLDYCTKVTAIAPASRTPTLWLQFLNQVTGGDVELQKFLQRMVGYCLTGVTNEHALFFLYGTGANGKSVFISTIAGILHEYAKTASIETFTASTNDQHPTDRASLQGARLVTASETEEGRRWAESKVKLLTGGDKIAARFMRQDFFEFTPQFKLVVAGNHKPGLRSVDEAIRRRLFLVPFNVTIPEGERDKDLPNKLRQEWAAILGWAIEGCRMWQIEGLNAPAAVRNATGDYLSEEDALGRWQQEQCVLGPEYMSAASVLFEDWRRWCEANGEFAGSQKRFSQMLEARTNVTKERTRSWRGFKGIALKSEVQS